MTAYKRKLVCVGFGVQKDGVDVDKEVKRAIARAKKNSDFKQEETPNLPKQSLHKINRTDEKTILSSLNQLSFIRVDENHTPQTQTTSKATKLPPIQ